MPAIRHRTRIKGGVARRCGGDGQGEPEDDVFEDRNSENPSRETIVEDLEIGEDFRDLPDCSGH